MLLSATFCYFGVVSHTIYVFFCSYTLHKKRLPNGEAFAFSTYLFLKKTAREAKDHLIIFPSADPLKYF